MERTRPSLASVAPGIVVTWVGAWVVLLHVAHLVLLSTTHSPAHRAPVVVSTLVWSAITVGARWRWTRTAVAEMTVALSCGAVAMTADAVWSASPGHPHLVSAGLLALVLVFGTLSGTGPLGLCVAAGTAATTGGVCLSTWWQRQDLDDLVETDRTSAQLDPLTGLLDRRGLLERFAGLRTTGSAGRWTAAVVLHLDHSKGVNDSHGHAVGDQVLVRVAHVLRARARADEVRSAVAATTAAEVLSRLLVRADAALYEAKRHGRDRVVLAPLHDGAPAAQVRDGGSERAGAEAQRA